MSSQNLSIDGRRARGIGRSIVGRLAAEGAGIARIRPAADAGGPRLRESASMKSFGNRRDGCRAMFAR